jgi:hypothetical protein
MIPSVFFVSGICCYDSRVSHRSWLLPKSNRAVTGDGRRFLFNAAALGEAVESGEALE